MTYKQFLAALRKTPRYWILDKRGQIVQRDQPSICPWIAVRNATGKAPTGLGIFLAADNKPNHDLKTRRDLLSACGLKERKA